MNNKKNFISALILQLASIFQGLILPRLILVYFGSDVNGLISSITQFLSFISLLEGGLGAVVLAELYKPIEDKDRDKIADILSACQNFFNKLSAIFIIYTLILSIVYPVAFSKEFSFAYISTLVWILSFTTLSQYLFSITNKLLLQADQKIYVVNFVMAITVLLNLVISIIIIFVFPEIHVVKLGSALIYLAQPIVYDRIVKRSYPELRFRKRNSNYVLKNRWSGFGQNLAYFINMNTDIAVVTLIMGLTSVSVYSVYMLAINALRSLITNAANSYQSALGKYYAMDDNSNLIKHFKKFEKAFWLISMAIFFTCLLLINGFVNVYTSGVNDADYYQPLFAFIIILANMLYCIREPYRLLILAAGKFKETNFGATLEAVLNLVISIALVFRFGLIGIAIGTLIAIAYRMFYFIWFLKKDILHFEYSRYIGLFLTFGVSLAINGCLYFFKPIQISSIKDFIMWGIIVFAGECAFAFLLGKVLTSFDFLASKIKKNAD